MDLDNRLPTAAAKELRECYALPEPVFVTRPTMPPLDAYKALLEKIWQTRWLTNKSRLHQEFERRLAAQLGLEHKSLFRDGIIALLSALQALRSQRRDTLGAIMRRLSGANRPSRRTGIANDDLRKAS